MDIIKMEQATFVIALVFYVLATFVYLYYLSFKGEKIARFAPWLISIGWVFNTVSLGLRWYEAGHPPLWTLYEVSSFFAWCVALIYLFIENYTKMKIIGAFVMPLNVVVMGLGYTNIDQPTQLLPALQSPWLVIHVTIAFVSYAAFLVAMGMAYLYLLQEHFMKKQLGKVTRLIIMSSAFVFAGIWVFWLGGVFTGIFGPNNAPKGVQLGFYYLLGAVFFAIIGAMVGYPVGKKAAQPTFSLRLPPLEMLDDLSYRSIAFGFPMLTLAIITGSVWAHKAWGTYWAWDPKETWSLITWLVYAGYMHAHTIIGWRGRRAAYLAMVGFVGVIITFLGLNWINQFIQLQSMHLYL